MEERERFYSFILSRTPHETNYYYYYYYYYFDLKHQNKQCHYVKTFIYANHSILCFFFLSSSAKSLVLLNLTFSSFTAQVYDAFESPDGRLELTLSNGTSLITDYVSMFYFSFLSSPLSERSSFAINWKFLSNLEYNRNIYILATLHSIFFTKY
jgi:hypothetical protein